MALELFKDELARQLPPEDICKCGRSVTHLSEELLLMAGKTEAGSPNPNSFEGHVWENDWLFVPAVPVTRVCLAALADDIPLVARRMFAELLLLIVSMSSTGLIDGERDLVEECHTIARSGTWLLYAEILAARAPGIAGDCFTILQFLGEDSERLRTVYHVAWSAMEHFPSWTDGPDSDEPPAVRV
ncbi:hypothetical protein AB0L06_31835 [Spirillospora sp. NPDC052269]